VSFFLDMNLILYNYESIIHILYGMHNIVKHQ
jgi:hypothetical protein